MALSNQTRLALEIAMADAALAREIADGIDDAINQMAAPVDNLGALGPTDQVGGVAAQYSIVVTNASALNGNHFTLYDKDGATVFWYDLTGSTPQPSVPGANRYVEIATVVASDNQNAVAQKTSVAIAADISFTSNFFKETVSATDQFKGGPRQAPAAGTSGFAINQIHAGENKASDYVSVDERVDLLQAKIDELLTKLRAANLVETE